MIIDLDTDDEDLLFSLQTIRKIERESNKNMEIILLHSPKLSEIQQDELNAIDLKCSLLKPFNLKDLHEFFKGDRLSTGKEQKEIEKYNYSRPPRILIAEDVAMNMLLFKTILTKYIENVKISEASNGYEAFQLFKNNCFDFVLMDLRMPEMDGIEATKKIREFEKEADYHTPIVALTASAIREEEIKSMEAGMDAFLSKPVDENKLINCFLKYVKPMNNQIRSKTKAEQTPNQMVHFEKEKLLRKISQDLEIFKEILETAKSDFDSRLSVLGRAIGESEENRIQKEAHAIKGSAFEVCFMKFGEIAKSIEMESDDIVKAKQNYQLLMSEWEIVKAIIEEELK
ncbi:MAG: response regulator, partial [Thermotogota bacterium]|nr:response regulator [Thermotogota bacterium]